MDFYSHNLPAQFVERREALYAQARHARLLRELRGPKPKRTRAQAAKAALGRALIRWGARLTATDAEARV
ncbi:MAG: hypothetical protein JO359_01575 [Candidatus Eremiobacteraeota bacterium]|nr:hypothetical protein [Candidatus Eremiobacteraeota bacterium]